VVHETNGNSFSAAPKRRACKAAAALLLCCAALGCATPPGEILRANQNSPTWPAPPLEPRVVCLGQFVTADDLRPGKTFWQKLVSTMFGARQPGALVTPQGLLLTASRELLVVDSAGRCIHRFGLDDRRYTQMPLNEVTQTPIGIAMDTQGRLYVTDPPASSIAVLDQEGKLLSRFSSERMLRPTGIAFSQSNSLLYVADTSGHRVLAFDLRGRVKLEFGGPGGHPGQFNYPTGLSVANGRIYVCDSFNFRVQIFDLAGEHIRSFGEEGNRPGNFSLPKAVAVDGAEHIWVVDARFENIQAFDSSGRLLMAFGEEGWEAGQFCLPGAIFIDSADRMFVSDSYNRRVQVFQLRPGDQ
jgi:sugar lactone lactonase YvrE